MIGEKNSKNADKTNDRLFSTDMGLLVKVDT
jgi:hypothetical protein